MSCCRHGYMISINDMKTNMKRDTTNQDGITLLITLLLMGVLLAVSAALLNITLKQFQLAGFSYASEIAFQAASAGVECALYHDFVSGHFEVGDSRNAVSCFGVVSDDTPASGVVLSGQEQQFSFTWIVANTPGVRVPTACTEFSVLKFYDASAPEPMPGIDRDGDGIENDSCPQGSV